MRKITKKHTRKIGPQSHLESYLGTLLSDASFHYKSESGSESPKTASNADRGHIFKENEYFRSPSLDTFITPEDNIYVDQGGAMNTPKVGSRIIMVSDPNEYRGSEIDNSFYETSFVSVFEPIKNIMDKIKAQGEIKRDWTAYNNAQIQEVELFEKLLKELVSIIPKPEQKRGKGRPRTPIGELIHACVNKLYHGVSSRRTSGYIERDMHFNMFSRTLMRAEITPILHELIRASSLPLVGIEKDFAVDSTGFSCVNFNEYHGYKHHKKRDRKWLKLHACSGVDTNIVSSASITDAHGGDSPEFKGLVRKTADAFKMEEVSADKAYSSRKNHEVAEEVGADCYIPFKKNASKRPKGSKVWKDAYHLFQLHPHKFNNRYHKRSNVESTIGALKAKFGEGLRSKDRTAQENELLCKVLAYNITVVIHEMFEREIDPKFVLEA